MGPSGSGKSTLLYCLAGILIADKGTVLYKDRDLAQCHLNDLIKLRRTSFGFIFQFGELVPELPVRDNIALPLLLGGVRKRKAHLQVSGDFRQLLCARTRTKRMPLDELALQNLASPFKSEIKSANAPMSARLLYFT